MTRGYLTEVREFPSSFGINVMLVQQNADTKPNELIVCTHPIILCDQITFCKIDKNDQRYEEITFRMNKEHAREISIAFHANLELLLVWVQEKLSEHIFNKEVARLLLEGLESIVIEAESQLPHQN